MKETIKIIDTGAVISECRNHRYELWRTWNYDEPRIMFIGLNPSRADEKFNDPTIRRCIDFARAWQYGSLYFANLYSYRTPFVKGPVPPHLNKENFKPLLDVLDQAKTNTTDEHLQKIISSSEKIVVCWGSWKFTAVRENEVVDLIQAKNKEPYCFGTNKDGSPKHPLYLAKTTGIEIYSQI